MADVPRGTILIYYKLRSQKMRGTLMSVNKEGRMGQGRTRTGREESDHRH